MAHWITCELLPLGRLLQPDRVKAVLQARRLDGQIRILLRAPRAPDTIVRQRRMAVREVHEALEPLGLVQLDEPFSLLDGRGRAGRPLRELMLQVDDLLRGPVGVFYRASLVVGARRAASTGAFELEHGLEEFLPFGVQAQRRRVRDGDFLVLLDRSHRVDEVCQQVGREEILSAVETSNGQYQPNRNSWKALGTLQGHSYFGAHA